MKLVWSLLGGNNGRAEHDLQNIQIVMWLFVDFLFAHQLLGGAGGFTWNVKTVPGQGYSDISRDFKNNT